MPLFQSFAYAEHCRRTLFASLCLITSWAIAGADDASYQVRGDAIPAPLVGTPGDAARGREILVGREANCLLCHAVPDGPRFMGNVGPPLAGIAKRLSAGQLRLRIVDSTIVNRDTVMPPYFRVRDLNQVATAVVGKPILSAQQVEDVVAYLLTLH